MVAAAVLLDRRVAFRAFLGVRRDPVCSLRVVFALLEPPLDKRAWCGLMVGKCAAKAERMPEGTGYGGNDFEEVALLDGAVDGENAVRRWAPLQVLLVVDICASEEFLVPFLMLAIRSPVRRQQ